jgi:rare lipoprotein A
MLPSLVWNGEQQYPSSIAIAGSGFDSDVVGMALTNIEPPAASDLDTSSASDVEAQQGTEACLIESMAGLSLVDLPIVNLMPLLMAAQERHSILGTMGVALHTIGTSGVDVISYARHKMMPDFATAYRALVKRVAMLGLPRIQTAAPWATIIGTVSTYNPYRDGKEEGGPQTASGELYDPAGWTAAIKTDLRNRFGGVRFGKLYQPTFALLESGDKQLIVKINDVGPLRPGRVLDLNERSMRHFDPYLTRGLVEDVKITLLPGEDWTPGPVGVAYAINFVPEPTTVARSALISSTSWQIDAGIARQLAPAAYPRARGDMPTLASLNGGN